MNIAKMAASMGPGRVPVSMLQEAISAGVPAAAAIGRRAAKCRIFIFRRCSGGRQLRLERAFSPALSASIQANDPVSGHAALAHDVFGQ